MTFTDLLAKHGLDPRRILLLRHRPHEPRLRKRLPWLAEDRPAVFNAYQQAQTPKVEAAMARATHVASFIGMKAATAHFVGLYAVGRSRPVTREQFWRIPANAELGGLGMRGFAPDSVRNSILWFALEETNFYPQWKGRLIVDWPPPERSWWRRAHRNNLQVRAILEESAFAEPMPDWRDLAVTWQDLELLPRSWRDALVHWRGIYYIFDTSDRRGYVGSASGEQNLLGRWKNYAARGDGGNRLLRNRDPKNFVFTILQRESPDMTPQDIVVLENTWKLRLHSRQPHGLNIN